MRWWRFVARNSANSRTPISPGTPKGERGVPPINWRTSKCWATEYGFGRRHRRILALSKPLSDRVMTMSSVQLDLQFWVARFVHWLGRSEPMAGAAEAAASFVLGSNESVLALGPEVIEASLLESSGHEGPLVIRLAGVLHRELIENPDHPEAPSAARTLCVFFKRSKLDVPETLVRLSCSDNQTSIDILHVIARSEDEERLLNKVRSCLQLSRETTTRMLEAMLNQVRSELSD